MALARENPELYSLTQKERSMNPNEAMTLTPRDSAEKLISQAIEKNVPVETMERLLAMRTQLKAEYAKEQFDRAMATFQSKCPTIKKTKAGGQTKGGQTAYYYAPIESIFEQVKDLLAEAGFSYAIQTETEEKYVAAICIVKHKFGHSESSSFRVPISAGTQIMSLAQVTASALTFAKRYAFCNAFGILTGDDDADGQDLQHGHRAEPDPQTETRPEQKQREHTELKEFDPSAEEIGFGKHSGTVWALIPSDYLTWMANSEKSQPDTKAKADATLKYKESIAKQVPDPLDAAFGKKPVEQSPMQPTAIEALQDSLDTAFRSGSLEALEGWRKINKDALANLSEMEKEELRKAYNAAKKQLENK